MSLELSCVSVPTLKHKYDQAFPALAAQIAPVFNNEKGYVVSGFRAGAYGAEFLLFNTTDTFLRLDAETGNFLRISRGNFYTRHN